MEQLANNPVTTLSANINNSVTSLTVVSASLFPTSGNFTIKIGTELLRVTAVSGTTFTVARGQEGTTAASHSSGDGVVQVVTNNVIQNLFSETIQYGPYSSLPSTARAGTIYNATDIDLSWIYDGSNWNLHKPLYVPNAHKMDISTWTALSVGSDVWNNINGVIVLDKTNTDGLFGYYKALPTAPYNIYTIIGILPQVRPTYISSIFLYDTVGGKGKTFGMEAHSSGPSPFIGNWTSSTVFSSTLYNGAQRLYSFIPYTYIRFEDDNTNWNYYISHDANQWIKIYSEVRNNFVTPNKVGLCVERDSSVGDSTTKWHHAIYGYWEA